MNDMLLDKPADARPIQPAPKVRQPPTHRDREAIDAVEAVLDELTPEEARRVAGWCFDKYVKTPLPF